MYPARRFFGLSWREQLLLIQALALLALIRLGLWLVPLSKLRKLVSRLSGAPGDLAPTHRWPVQRIVWAVTAGSRYIPRATCLTQALAGQVLLARQGYIAQLHIGVARGPQRDLKAHAWLNYEGNIVIGAQPDLDRFAVFPPIQ